MEEAVSGLDIGWGYPIGIPRQVSLIRWSSHLVGVGKVTDWMPKQERRLISSMASALAVNFDQ
jgi:hypothetical protein